MSIVFSSVHVNEDEYLSRLIAMSLETGPFVANDHCDALLLAAQPVSHDRRLCELPATLWIPETSSLPL